MWERFRTHGNHRHRHGGGRKRVTTQRVYTVHNSPYVCQAVQTELTIYQTMMPLDASVLYCTNRLEFERSVDCETNYL